MTATTDNIDRLVALPSDDPPGWTVRFRSTHAGRVHQLYANGRLVDWTDAPSERELFLPPDDAPREVVVAAVDPAERGVDYAGELDLACSWAFEASIVRDVAHAVGSRLEVLTDAASGALLPEPSAVLDLWPDAVRPWAWGQDAFARGAFGWDGVLALGLDGAFGAGAFGTGAELIALSVPLTGPGEHRVVLRTVSPDGVSAEVEHAFTPAAPPPPPARVRATAYDDQARLLTLQIEDQP